MLSRLLGNDSSVACISEQIKGSCGRKKNHDFIKSLKVRYLDVAHVVYVHDIWRLQFDSVRAHALADENMTMRREHQPACYVTLADARQKIAVCAMAMHYSFDFVFRRSAAIQARASASVSKNVAGGTRLLKSLIALLNIVNTVRA